MPVNWYLALLLVAGCVALGDQLLRLRWSRGGFLLALVLALAGTALGWALYRGMNLPELVPMKVEGKDFPLLWAVTGGAVLVGTFEQFASRRRRHRT